MEVSEAELLATCQMDIEALTKANGLEDVIAQVQSGEVQRIREKYGPDLKHRRAIPKWSSIKSTLNRRERVFGVLRDDFNNDEARFFAFFKLTSTAGKRPTTYQSVRKIAGALPHMREDVNEEKAAVQYQDPQSGIFSDALWQQRWQGQNEFEVWRSMGKESYTGL